MLGDRPSGRAILRGMTPGQIIKAAEALEPIIMRDPVHPRQGDAVRLAQKTHLWSFYERRDHLLWMLERVKHFVRVGDTEKACRWLGFVQGSLWTDGLVTIDDLREQCRAPKDPWRDVSSSFAAGCLDCRSFRDGACARTSEKTDPEDWCDWWFPRAPSSKA